MRNEDELKNLTRKKSLKSDYNFFGNLFIKCPSLPVFVKPRSFEQTMCVCLCVVCVCVLPFISFTSDPSIINNNITSLYRLSLDLCMHVCFSLCVCERERLGVYMWSQYCSASCLDNGHTDTHTQTHKYKGPLFLELVYNNKWWIIDIGQTWGCFQCDNKLNRKYQQVNVIKFCHIHQHHGRSFRDKLNSKLK